MKIAATFKGWLGETLLILAKKISLDGRVYHDINNVTISTTNGTTQIDHIIVSKYGIFVVETKNMKGCIYGAEDQAKWTQSFRKSQYQFQNPIRQNFRHTKALQELLHLPSNIFHSVICFVGSECEIKSVMPENVILGKPFSYIKKKNEIVLYENEILQIVQTIKENMHPKNVFGFSTMKTKKEHLASLKERHDNAEKCPVCDSNLMKRTKRNCAQEAQYFYGCTMYPICCYTRPISDTLSNQIEPKS